jgi:hypothetical protein
MKTKTFLLSLVGLSAISLFSFTKNTGTIGAYSHFDARFSGGADFGKTGAPGENNCTQCHSGTAIANSTVTFLSFSGTNNKYIPGSTYTINVELVGAPSPTNGFEIVALRNSDDANVGSITITDVANTQLKNGNSRTYVTHTSTGSTISSWNFDWTAPINPEGDITFYVATNVSNDNGGTSGDEIHLKELVIQQDASSAVIEQAPIVDLDNSLKLLNNNNFITTTIIAEQTKDILTSVLSLSGKVIYSNYEVLNKGNNTLETIDFNQFAKGIYIINYKVGNDLMSRKILI